MTLELSFGKFDSENKTHVVVPRPKAKLAAKTEEEEVC